MAAAKNEGQQSWIIHVVGHEIVENRDIVKVGGKDTKVYGTSRINYVLEAAVALKQVRKKWVLDSGKITKAKITDHALKYAPSNAYDIKKVYCSGKGVISGFAGRKLGGSVPKEGALKLMWPMPTGFSTPSVQVVSKGDDGEEREAAFVSLHFMDYISAYTLVLKKGWSKTMRQKFSGAMERAECEWKFSVKEGK